MYHNYPKYWDRHAQTSIVDPDQMPHSRSAVFATCPAIFRQVHVIKYLFRFLGIEIDHEMYSMVILSY